MSYSTDLIDGLAALLQEAGIATYRPDGPAYTATETGLTVAVVPPAPDRLITLTDYPVDDTDLTDATTGVQVRMRAGPDPRAVMAISDDVFDLLHNRRSFHLGPVFVGLCWRQSEAPMGTDVHGRIERSANYYLRTSRSSPNLYD